MTSLFTEIAKAAEKLLASGIGRSVPFDPLAVAQSTGEFALGLASRPADLLHVQIEAAQEWGEFWSRAMWGLHCDKPRDRRFAAPQWQDEAYFRTIRDSYLLASKQLRELLTVADKDPNVSNSSRATFRLLVDQYVNAVAPTNFALTNPEVLERIRETNGGNLVQGFRNLIEDLASGKGLVQRRTDPTAFEKGKTIAATPGQVVFEGELFQLIQYKAATDQVAAEPLLYVPPLVNRYYMIDLVPRQSMIKWLVEQGRTVFVISWVNPTEAHRDKGVGDYVFDGIVAAIGQVRERTGQAPDLYGFCLGGTLVAIALAWLAAV